MLHETAEMCEGGPDAQLTAVRDRSFGSGNTPKGFPLDELRELRKLVPVPGTREA